ncbi:MAG: prepilin-type N-terminal cleavage/methylation domain-containing protein [Chthonomonadales bacterium]|nr:prepilin-type N-terminal cleavage/methylation domain-containing protein [Chthonomonadales bacterium]
MRTVTPRRSGFTLVELLVVMAITTILLGLLFGPMVQGFDLTNRARVQVQAQDTARQIMATLERDIGDGVFIHDNSGQDMNFWVLDPAGGPALPARPAIVMGVPFARIDLVPPARVNDQNPAIDPNVPIDPTTGLPVEDERGDLAVPVAPGRVIHRYWLGLRDNTTIADNRFGTSGRPRKPYVNFYDNARTRTLTLADHNPFLLLRASFTPYTLRGFVDTRLMNLGRYGTLEAALADPNFYYDNDVVQQPPDPTITSPAMPGWKDLNGDGEVNYSENWRAIARTLVPTDRADMVTVERDDNGNPIYDVVGGSVRMRLTPEVRFQPTYIGNDPGVPSSRSDTGSESPNVPPSSHVETHGHWAIPFNAFVYRSSLTSPVLEYFFWDGTSGRNVQYVTFDTVSGTITSAVDTGFNPRNPTLLPGVMTPGRFLMFTVDERRGVLNFAFPHSITQGGAAEPTRIRAAQANGEFNYVRGSAGNALSAYRTVSLLPYDETENPTGMLPGDNPTDPNPALWRIPDARIVPGSETVVGPDMRPGPNYGRPITYTRAPRNTDPRELGPNEYLINYANIANANLGVTDPDPRVQAMMRTIQRAGTIIFNSADDAPGTPNSLPEAINNLGDPAFIEVTYQVQNNRSSDVVKASYLTREMITAAVSVRLYDFRSQQPQSATLTQKIKVRNLQR